MSAFMLPDGGINPVVRSYPVDDNEGQLLTRAETLSQRTKNNLSLCAYLFIILTELRRVQASQSGGISQTSPPPGWSPLRATLAGV